MTLPSIPVSPTTTGQDEINDRRHYRSMPLGKMSKVEIKYTIPGSDVIYTKRRLIEHPERPKDGIKTPEERLLHELGFRTKGIQPITMSCAVACATSNMDQLSRFSNYEADFIEYWCPLYKLGEVVRAGYEQGIITQVMIAKTGTFYKFKTEDKAPQWILHANINQNSLVEKIKLGFYVGETVIYINEQAVITDIKVKKDKSIFYHITTQTGIVEYAVGRDLGRMWL